jgi:eukaryotic-like serine/threonine-protein kinase
VTFRQVPSEPPLSPPDPVTTAAWVPDPEDREALLAVIVERLLTERRGERPVPLEEEIAKHPDLARDLRELWAAAEIADSFGRSDEFAEEYGELLTSGSSVATPLREFGDYDLLEELGRGGMGVVYKARHRTLDRIVALKMVLRGDLATPQELERLRAEAGAAAQLDHPHIVPVYEVGEVDGRPYFSMKYVAGTTLAALLADGPLDGRTTARLLVPVCRAVDAAHERGILHRDLKPSNILIDAEGQPLVTDFGLAKRLVAEPRDSSGDSRGRAAVAVATQTGAILGTPGYMSPEQAAGARNAITPASDVHSLGAILYQCVTGRPPFQASSPVDVLLMVLEQDPVPPRMLDPKIDRDLEMVILKCLQKPPDLRYSSAAALADDLQAWLSNEPISARSTNIGQLLSRMLRETHHAVLLESWGLLWMWHSLVLLCLCLATNWFQFRGIASRVPYLTLWVVGLGLWAMIFWSLRHRSGPITFVERQIAHVWGATMASSMLLFALEWQLDLPVLTLSPVLAILAAIVFAVKAGILSGTFYIYSILMFLTSLAMAGLRRPGEPDYGLTVYGIASALGFFVPGLKYYRQRHANRDGGE